MGNSEKMLAKWPNRHPSAQLNHLFKMPERERETHTHTHTHTQTEREKVCVSVCGGRVGRGGEGARNEVSFNTKL